MEKLVIEGAIRFRQAAGPAHRITGHPSNIDQRFPGLRELLVAEFGGARAG